MALKWWANNLSPLRVSKCNSPRKLELCLECDKVARPVVKYFSCRSSQWTSHIKKCCKLEAYFLSTYQGWSFPSLTIRETGSWHKKPQQQDFKSEESTDWDKLIHQGLLTRTGRGYREKQGVTQGEAGALKSGTLKVESFPYHLLPLWSWVNATVTLSLHFLSARQK